MVRIIGTVITVVRQGRVKRKGAISTNNKEETTMGGRRNIAVVLIFSGAELIDTRTTTTNSQRAGKKTGCNKQSRIDDGTPGVPLDVTFNKHLEEK
jgi:hypothetical protein